VRTFAGATDVCTLLEGDVVEPVTIPALAEGPLDTVDDEALLDDVPEVDDEEVLVDELEAEAVEVEPPADAESPPAPAEPDEPPEPVPPPPELVELLVAATCAGGALEAAAKMKLGVGTNLGAAPGRTCTVCPGRDTTVTSSPDAVRAVTLCAPVIV